MVVRRKFKAMELTNWYKAKRGGAEARNQKDTPSTLVTKANNDANDSSGTSPPSSLASLQAAPSSASLTTLKSIR